MVFIALEVAESKLDLAAFDAEGRELGRKTILNCYRGFGEALEWLAALATSADVIVGAEGEGGYASPFDEIVADRGYRFVALPPHQVASQRQAMGLHDKSDNNDLVVIAQMLRSRYGQQPTGAVANTDATTRSLCAMSRTMQRLTDERTRLLNRMRSLVHQYWPDLLFEEGVPELDSQGLLAVLERWATPAAVLDAAPGQITRVLRKASGGSKGKETTEALRRAAAAVFHVSAKTDSLAVEVRLLANQVRVLRQKLRELERRAETELAATPLGQSLLDWLNVGPKMALILFAAVQPLQDLKSGAALARLLGVAPTLFQSGKTNYHWSQRAHRHHAKRAIMLVARNWARKDPTSRDYVQRKTQAGKGYWAAHKCLARHLVRDLWKLILQSKAEQPPLKNVA